MECVILELSDIVRDRRCSEKLIERLVETEVVRVREGDRRLVSEGVSELLPVGS